MVDSDGGPSDLALCAIVLEKRSQGQQSGGFRARLFSARTPGGGGGAGWV